jgi:hypothetical protein
MARIKIDNNFYRLTLEKMVIGLEEPILIKGVGKMLAKIDSGNGGHNVIHGEDIIIQGDIINFKTSDIDGNSKRVSKKIKSTLAVNIGGGHIQERPVIELNVQFAGDVYKKILFSVTDRSDNEHKVLISKDFVGKELDALIDVSKNNISNDGIEVEYVSEGLGDIIKGAVMGTEGGEQMKNRSAAFLNSMLGKGASPSKPKTPEVPSDIEKELEEIGKLKELLAADKALIQKKIPTLESDFEKIDVKVDSKLIDIYKIIDYTGNTNNDAVDADPEFKKWVKKSVAALKKQKAKDAKSGNKTLAKESTDPNIGSQNTETQPAASGTSEDNAQQNNQNQDQQQEDEYKELITPEELAQFEKDLIARKKFVFYYVSFKQTKSGKPTANAPEYFKKVQADIDKYSKSILNGASYGVKDFEPIAKNIAHKLSKEKIECKGVFVLCYGPRAGRQCEFITKFLIGENSKDTEKFIKQYNKLNAEFLKLLGPVNDGQPLGSQSLEQSYNNVAIELYKAYNEQFKQYAAMVEMDGELTTDNLDNLINILNNKLQ